MKAIGYAKCVECGGTYRGYPPRGYKPGDQLAVWSHTHDREQHGWGRRQKCEGSYKSGTDTVLSSELDGGNQ